MQQSAIGHSNKETGNYLMTTCTKGTCEPTYMDPIKKLQNKVDEILRGKQRLKLLEAGCGSKSHLEFENPYVVGLDISSKQLDRNKHLSERIQGDIQYYDLTGFAFDVIICWDVLEHLRHPQKAIQNFFNALRSGGILILAGPNPMSFWGLITKFTPTMFHNLYYRCILGSKHAGKEDLGPFKTHMRLSMRPKEIIKLTESDNNKVVYLDIFEAILQKRLRRKYKLADWLFRLISICYDPLNKSSFVIVLQKT